MGAGRAFEPLALAALLAGVCVLLGRIGDWRAALGRFQAWMLVAFAAWALAVVRRSRWAAVRAPVVWVVAVAALLRAALLPAAPTLSDDLYRYAWDGRVLAAGIDPYAHAPADPALAPLRDAVIHPRINHPALRTIYPPLAEAGFGLVGVVRSALPHANELLLDKLWIVVNDLALCLLLCLACGRRGSAWDAIVYAWNPLVVAEYAGSGHHDPTGIVWLVAALMWSGRAPVRSALAAAAAVLVKLVALPALPFLAREWSRTARIAGALALLGGLGLYAALARGPGSGLEAFANHWRHNESLFAPLAALWGDHTARFVAAGLLATIVVLLLVSGVRTETGVRTTLKSALLLGPVLHPWYLGWVLALEPLGPSPAWLLLSCTALLAYGAGSPPLAGGAYHPSVAWRFVEYGLPLATAVGIAAGARIRRLQLARIMG